MSKEFLICNVRMRNIAVWCDEHGIENYKIIQDITANDIYTGIIVYFRTEEDLLLFELGYDKPEDRRITAEVIAE